MLLKNGQSPQDLNSYRPISMTPCLARLFERLVLERLQQHLVNNNIIISNQSGFRKARQTKDNLLALIQNAQEGFNYGEKSYRFSSMLLLLSTKYGMKDLFINCSN